MPRQTASKPKIKTGPHYVYCVIGIDGSFISEAYWHKVSADDYCPEDCRVEKFRLVRCVPKKAKRL